jgi:signal peptidase II
MDNSGKFLRDKRSLVVLLIVLAHVALDQLTKTWIRGYPVNDIIGQFGFIIIRHIQNAGIGFGLFQGHTVPIMIIMGVGLLVLIGLLFWAYRRYPQFFNYWTLVAYSLIIGGTIGNLLDRVRQAGAVTDFIDPQIWPVFNVADMGISIGGVMLAVYIIRLAVKEKK